MNEDIKYDAATAADKATGKARELTGKADDALASLQDKINEFRANATIDEYLDRAKTCIRSKPFKAVGLAFIAGCIWHGMKMRRR